MAAALTVLSLVLLSSCGSAQSPASSTTGTSPPATSHSTSKFRHVFLIVMENLSYSSALSTSGLVALASKYASASDYYASSHPSLPNYLALTSGSTYGYTSDCLTCYVTANNLGAQLSAKRVSWEDYSEDLPATCYLGTSFGEYAAKHNPFRYYTDIRASKPLCDHLLGLDALTSALTKSASAVPAFSFVTPNLCNDGHDCPASTAATWLTGFLKQLTTSAAYKQHGLVIVTWDEGAGSDTSSIQPDGAVSSSGGGGHVFTLFSSPGLAAGIVVRQPLNHYAILATIERNFGLSYLKGASAWSSHTLALP